MSTEHFKPVLEQISKLEEALYNIQFEQDWLEAQTDRQAIGKNNKLILFSLVLTTRQGEHIVPVLNRKRHLIVFLEQFIYFMRC